MVDDVKPDGSTRLFDCMDNAIDSLINYHKQNPSCILRIIALTDGDDNASKNKPEEIVKRIVDNQITIDSFVVSEQCQ